MERKEAIEVIKKNYPDSSFTMLREALETLIPELRESDDERIRKEILDCFKTMKQQGCFPSKHKEQYEPWIAWLEKQGEQKPADKVEPKFKVGDYIERKDDLGCHAKIIFVGGNMYGCEKLIYPKGSSPFFEFRFKNQDEFRLSSDFQQKSADKVEPKFHEGEWVVQENIGVYKVIEVCESWYEVVDNKDKHYSIGFDKEYMCHLYTIQDAKTGDVLVCKGNIKYSNGIKYERICLFNNLDKAFFTLVKTSNYVETYDIDVDIDYPDNTVPATKEQRDTLFAKMKESGYEWDAEKKQLKKIHVIDEGKSEIDYCFTKMMNGEKINYTWSEEDERTYKSVLYAFEHNYPLISEQQNFVKSLRDRVQPKQEWSKENEEMLRRCINATFGHGYLKECNWLNSLRPQNHWKPTKQQLSELRCVISGCSFETSILVELEENLKKLL